MPQDRVLLGQNSIIVDLRNKDSEIYLNNIDQILVFVNKRLRITVLYHLFNSCCLEVIMEGGELKRWQIVSIQTLGGS